jgi:hypothetical protein
MGIKLADLDRLIVRSGTVKIGPAPAISEAEARRLLKEIDQRSPDAQAERERIDALARDDRRSFDIRLLSDVETEALLSKQWPPVRADDPGRGDPEKSKGDARLLRLAVEKRTQIVRVAQVGISLGIEVAERSGDWLVDRGLSDRNGAGEAGGVVARALEGVGRALRLRDPINSFDAPNHRARSGDFRSRGELLRYLRRDRGRRGKSGLLLIAGAELDECEPSAWELPERYAETGLLRLLRVAARWGRRPREVFEEWTNTERTLALAALRVFEAEEGRRRELDRELLSAALGLSARMPSTP